MIKKLEQRIFLLIMLALSVIVLGTIIIFTILNYNNTINTTNFMMDRFIGEEPRKELGGGIEDYKIRPEIDIDGVYNVIIKDNVIEQSQATSNEIINEYALKIAEKKTDKGIIEKYIYKVRKISPNAVRITFVENEDAISHIKRMYIFSVIISIISIIIIYIIAKKLSKIIVKPVEETFEKQKQFISDASHELKTPLAVIEANADVLENECRHKQMDKLYSK